MWGFLLKLVLFGMPESDPRHQVLCRGILSHIDERSSLSGQENICEGKPSVRELYFSDRQKRQVIGLKPPLVGLVQAGETPPCPARMAGEQDYQAHFAYTLTNLGTDS